MGTTNGMKLGFTKPEPNKEVEEKVINNNNSPVEGNGKDSSSQSANESEDLSLPYIDRRTVTIALVRNYSLYRKQNDKELPKRRDYIGSSLKSSRMLSSNKQEVEAYFPNIVGVSPNDPSFVQRVKQWINNIRVAVDELGTTLDISFNYNTKKDYLTFKKEEDKIEDEYLNADKSTLTNLKEALNIKITKLHDMESKKYAVGSPLDVNQYLIYRHCLLYNDIAKDIALVNSMPNIRFYFKDDKREAEKLKKYRTEVLKAKANFVKCSENDNLFEAVYVQYCALNNRPIMPSLAKDRIEKEMELDKFSSDEPIKFNAICTDKDIELKATIEKLISKGELIRSLYNQNISSPTGEFIGSNIKEAVAYFKDPNNTSIVNAYYNKLKNITTFLERWDSKWVCNSIVVFYQNQ